MKMKIHRVIIKDKKGLPFSEARYCEGLLFRQNRSHDLELSLDDFIDRLNTTKKLAEKKGFAVDYQVFENDAMHNGIKWVA